MDEVASCLPTSENKFPSHVFNYDRFSDVLFFVGKDLPKKAIPAHKIILAMKSPVFSSMFESQLSLKSNVVEVSDIELVPFLALLRFCYLDVVDLSSENVMQILYAARKYAITDLRTRCVKFIRANLSPDDALSPDTAFRTLLQARILKDVNLAIKCLRTIDLNCAAFESADFLDLSFSTLCNIISRDTLKIKEIQVFRAVMRWSEVECRRRNLQVQTGYQRKVLGRALRLIRFPLMKVEEFDEVVKSKILRDGEMVSISHYICTNQRPPIHFPYLPRSSPEFTVSRFGKNSYRTLMTLNKGITLTQHCIDFTVDYPIAVVGFGFYRCEDLPSSYNVSIKFCSEDSSLSVESNRLPIKFDDPMSSHIYIATLEEPIELRENKRYRATLSIEEEELCRMFFGFRGKSRIVVDSLHGPITFNFFNSNCKSDGTSVEFGQLPEFIFKLW